MARGKSETKASTTTFKGRQFEPEEIRLIAEVVAGFPRLSRQELANTVCELVDWRRPNRGLKTWEARDLLEELERTGLIKLPAPTSMGRPRGSKTSVPHTERGEMQPELVASLGDVEPVTMRLVQTPEDRRLWRELVGRYHPDGHRVPFGAHLRYLVEIARPTTAVVACLQLSSPAWKMAVRDRFIGWSDAQRRAHLQKIVNQSRFLVLPWIRIPHLASRILGLMVRRFPADWKQAYGIEPVLLETLVEEGRAGTCYKAANWKLVGETTGRGRMDRYHRREGLARKQVFVYPLVAHATEVLRGETSARRNIAEGAEMVCEDKKDRGEHTNQKWQDVRRRFELLEPHFDERARRYWLGAEALAYGRGGMTVVSEACGVSHRTVVAGMREVQEAATMQGRAGRIRRPGGGSKPIEERLPGIKKELEKLVDPCTRGDPESPLRWTSKSVRKLATELTKCGFPVGADTVTRLLRELKYSLQANRKTSEGKQHPDRDAQFCYIAQRSKEFLETGDPVISVDTKKKEKIGNYKNGGREYEPEGRAREVEMHDFGKRDADGQIIQGIPYGVYDQGRNSGWVSVGVDHDTAEFAVTTIGYWWKKMGQSAYPSSRRVMITADSGGSNGSRVRAWKTQLQRLADEMGLEFHVFHFPPGTSKWNKIEHRMFSQITCNWRGRPLTSHETIVNLISNTTTQTGLFIEAALDTARYQTGIKVPKKEFDAIRIKRDEFHPEWNYVILPRGSP
jgi:transposase